jgi:branched-chain amino acid transport system ATP-binding protein
LAEQEHAQRKSAVLLSVQDIDVRYGEVQVVRNCSLEVRRDEIVALFGGNGAGKTTLLRAISGLIKPKAGRIVFDGQEISSLAAHQLPELGLAHVPEGRHVFPQMSVQENLEMGAYASRVRARRKENMAAVFELFPALKERRKAAAGVLSGGQQQMLAIGRGLMAEPKLLLLDEPSLGLAPSIVTTLFETISRTRALGVTVLLVEQNLWESMEIADWYYLIATGEIVSSDIPRKLREDKAFRRVYLGV